MGFSAPYAAARIAAAHVRAGGKQAAVESFRNGTLLVFKAGEGGNFYEPTQHKRWAQSNDYFPISYSPVSGTSGLLWELLTGMVGSPATGSACMCT